MLRLGRSAQNPCDAIGRKMKEALKRWWDAWNSPEARARRWEAGVARAEAAQGRMREKKAQAAMKGMVRRTCLNCGHSWVVPKKMAKARGTAGGAMILGGVSGKVVGSALAKQAQDLATCVKCGSSNYFREG